MTKKFKPIKPMFPLKHEFTDSLDLCLQQAITLITAVRTVLELKQVDASAAVKLRECLDTFEAAMFGKGDAP
jgi:hypothetical protein